MSRSEQAVSYAALILADDEVGITVGTDHCLVLEDADQNFKSDKLLTLIKTANVEDVEPIWATLFAKALDGKNVKDMLLNVGSGGGAAVAPAGAASGGGGAPDASAEEEKKPEKEEEKEESDEDMGFGLFD